MWKKAERNYIPKTFEGESVVVVVGLGAVPKGDVCPNAKAEAGEAEEEGEENEKLKGVAAAEVPETGRHD